jgi:hypothetical protein
LAVSACGFHAQPASQAADAPAPTADAASPTDSLASGQQPPAPFCDPSDTTLVVCFEFENAVTDASAHHLTTHMTNVSFVPGKVGMAMMFGPTSAADIDDNPALDIKSITMETWIQPANLTDDSLNILDEDSQYAMQIDNDNKIHCTITNHAGLDGTATQIAPGQWTHVACTFDYVTGDAAMYADGVEIAHYNGDGPGTPLNTGGKTGLSIAADNNPQNKTQRAPFIGLVDQFRIFSVARTATQICQDALKTQCP